MCDLSVQLLSHAFIDMLILFCANKHGWMDPFLFFCTKRHGNIPMGTPLTEAANAGGVWNNRSFRPISRFISETTQDRAIVTVERKWDLVRYLSNGHWRPFEITPLSAGYVSSY